MGGGHWQGPSRGRYERDHLAYQEIEDLNLTVVTENGETVTPEKLRGRILRIVDRDEPGGYVVRNMETTGECTTLRYPQATGSQQEA